MVMKFECKVKFGKHLKCVTFLVPLPLWHKKQRKRTLMKILLCSSSSSTLLWWGSGPSPLVRKERTGKVIVKRSILKAVLALWPWGNPMTSLGFAVLSFTYPAHACGPSTPDEHTHSRWTKLKGCCLVELLFSPKANSQRIQLSDLAWSYLCEAKEEYRSRVWKGAILASIASGR